MRLAAGDHLVRLGWIALAGGAAASGAGSKTWVLGPDPGAGGQGACFGAGGAGGAPAAPGAGGVSGLGGRGDSGTGGSHVGGSCRAVPVQSSPFTADMVFVVGRNASMSTAFDNTIRMTAVQFAVHNVVVF